MDHNPSKLHKVESLIEEKEHNLIKRCIDWDRNAQNELYNRYANSMFAVCFRYSRTREDAEDTFSEGFMKVFESIKNFKYTGSLEGWIRRIMVNSAIDKFRKNTIKLDDFAIIENQPEIKNSYYDNFYSQFDAEELMRLVQKLPPAYKMVFNLYAIEGFKHKEIADLLGISEGTSKSNLSDARAILQKAINKNSNNMDHSLINDGRK